MNDSAPSIRQFLVPWLLLLPIGTIGCGSDENVVTEIAFEENRIDQEVNEFCGACHATPDPELFPAPIWVREVEFGYSMYAESGRNDLQPPVLHEVVEYFRRRAKPAYEFPAFDAPGENPVRLDERTALIPSDRQGKYPAISHIHYDSSSQPPVVVYGDMRSGDIVEATWQDNALTPRVIGHVSNPARINQADLDGDGQRDWIVADLGNFLPAMDHYEGAVYWLRNMGDEYETVLLAENLGRVADVQAADFDQDGDQDLIVAEFGWRRTGRLLLLRQVEIEAGVPQFELSVLDQRHGSMHVPIVDANGDGLMDFVVLFSQEYESIELFLNRGDAQFERIVLYEAGAPSYGSTAIDLVDLDQDGDLDISWTNGDAFDSTDLRPYHQVQWLENDGDWTMTHHPITVMPGAHRALPTDLDRDGDIDLVAVALLPDHLANDAEADIHLSATIWLEQTEDGQFIRRELTGLPCHRAALAIGDINGDSVPDIITGKFQFQESGERAPDLTYWLNLTPLSTP